jgi:rhomboid protease GluP
MNPSLQTKLRLIYFPFLLLGIGLTASYTFVNWLFIMKLHLIVLKTEMTNFWIPFILPWLPILIWHRKRIKLLRINNKGRDPATALSMLAAFAIIAPLIIAQEFMVTNSGTLTTLNNAGEMTLSKDSRYYKIQYYAIDRSYTRSHFTREVTGKTDNHLDFTLYLVSPLYDKGHIPVSNQDSAASPVAWVCKKYTKQISNNLSPDEKQEKKEAFITDCQKDYQSEPVTGYTYFDEIPYSNDYIGYKKAAENSNRYQDNGHLHLLVPQSEPFENRNGNKLPWIFGSFAIGAVVYFLILLFIPLDEAKVKAWTSGDTTKNPKHLAQNPQQWKESLAWIIPRKGFFATPIIVYLNLLVFLAMVVAGLGFINFSAGDLLAWGANYGPDIADGQWWRLLTAIFVHAGFMHLLLNMYGLLFVGLFLEPVLGEWRFAIYYLATGLLASIASLWIHPDLVGVGASGAIFGMYGVFLACLLTGVFPPGMKKAFLLSTLIFVGANLVMGLSGNIDNAAHIGGLLAGFLIGFFFSRTRPDPAP